MLILKQNTASSVPTPILGKGTLFLDDSDTLSIKTSDGNVETVPTITASNTQVVYANGTSLEGKSSFTYDFNNNILSVTGNITAGNLLGVFANGNSNVRIPAAIGNRMEIFITADGLKYLFVGRQGAVETFRQLVFY